MSTLDYSARKQHVRPSPEQLSPNGKRITRGQHLRNLAGGWALITLLLLAVLLAASDDIRSFFTFPRISVVVSLYLMVVAITFVADAKMSHYRSLNVRENRR
jgi:hypothetical protein